MREDKRQARMQEIETQAYALLCEQGYEATSMLAVARRAKASNETLYRWYGDKNGLFASMVRANAAKVGDLLQARMAKGAPPLQTLAEVAPVLLGMLLSEKAIALNRAAASDPTGVLGQVLATGGREQILPLMSQVLCAAVASGDLVPPEGIEIGALFMMLLVGDRQIRRVIGAMPEPSPEEIASWSQTALTQFTRLCAP